MQQIGLIILLFLCITVEDSYHFAAFLSAFFPKILSGTASNPPFNKLAHNMQLSFSFAMLLLCNLVVSQNCNERETVLIPLPGHVLVPLFLDP